MLSNIFPPARRIVRRNSLCHLIFYFFYISSGVLYTKYVLLCSFASIFQVFVSFYFYKVHSHTLKMQKTGEFRFPWQVIQLKQPLTLRLMVLSRPWWSSRLTCIVAQISWFPVVYSGILSAILVLPLGHLTHAQKNSIQAALPKNDLFFHPCHFSARRFSPHRSLKKGPMPAETFQGWIKKIVVWKCYLD